MILCRSVHKYITFCSEPLIRTLIRRIKCRISASQTFITYTMRIKSANITQKIKFFYFFENFAYGNQVEIVYNVSCQTE